MINCLISCYSVDEVTTPGTVRIDVRDVAKLLNGLKVNATTGLLLR